MGERKVVNKYYPPDFDPSKIPKGKRPRNDQMKVRSMMPMSVRCNACGEYIYKGKKFNVRKETVTGETYLGIKVFRFYFKCNRCSSEFTIKTDPKNGDYACETGASRNFEPWKDRAQMIAEAQAARTQEEEGDQMKALENKTIESKREIDILDALDELKTQSAVANKMGIEALVEEHKKKYAERFTDEEEALIKAAFHGGGGGAEKVVRRIEDDDGGDDDDDEAAEGQGDWPAEEGNEQEEGGEKWDDDDADEAEAEAEAEERVRRRQRVTEDPNTVAAPPSKQPTTSSMTKAKTPPTFQVLVRPKGSASAPAPAPAPAPARDADDALSLLAGYDDES